MNVPRSPGGWPKRAAICPAPCAPIVAAGDLDALEAEIAAVQRRGDLHSALNLRQEAIVVLKPV